MSRAVKVLVFSLICLTGVSLAVYFIRNRDEETRLEVVLRYTSELRAVGEDLRTLAAVMPQGRIDGSECPGLEAGQRPFRYYGADPRPDNLEFIMVDNLIAPGRGPRDLDPVNSQLTELVSIAETGSYAGGAEWYDGPAFDGFAKDVEELTQVEYVAVVRVADSRSPEVSESGFFHGGYMAVEVVVADLRAHTILCTATTEAEITEAEYVYSEYDSAEERGELAQAALEGELQSAARDALERALNDLDRGTFSGL